MSAQCAGRLVHFSQLRQNIDVKLLVGQFRRSSSFFSSTISANGWFSQTLSGVILAAKALQVFDNLFPGSTPSVESLHRFSVLLHPDAHHKPSSIFAFCYIVEFWARLFCLQTTSVLAFCPILPVFLAFSEHFLFSRQMELVRFYFHLQHMNLSILILNDFFFEFFSLSAMDHRWTIACQGCAAWDCHVHRCAPVNVMTIGELHWIGFTRTDFSVIFLPMIVLFNG